jgi:hypothetical protein
MNQDKKIRKLEAARRQIDCAIRIFIDGEDLLAVHTLSRAAFRILYDIYPHLSNDGFEKAVEAAITKWGWKDFSRVANFLKHADKDAGKELTEYDFVDTQVGMGYACLMYYGITGDMTAEMETFHIWSRILNPDKFSLPREEDEAEEQAYRDAAAIVRNGPQSDQLLLARPLLEIMRQRKQEESAQA